MATQEEPTRGRQGGFMESMDPRRLFAASSAEETKKEEDDSDSDSGSSTTKKILGVVLILALLAGIGFGVKWFMKKKSAADVIENLTEEVGAEVSGGFNVTRIK